MAKETKWRCIKEIPRKPTSKSGSPDSYTRGWQLGEELFFDPVNIEIVTSIDWYEHFEMIGAFEVPITVCDLSKIIKPDEPETNYEKY